MIEDEEDVSARENTKGKWAALAKLVGADERLQEVAEDLVEHFETHTAKRLNIERPTSNIERRGRDMWGA